MKAVLWSIRKPHTDNIKSGKKWDEIRKRIPKDLSPETVNYIYETKASGGCGKIIGEFKVPTKTYIYADIINEKKHLYNTAFVFSALSNEELFKYLYDSKKNDGWALRISKLKIYDKPKELSEFYRSCGDNPKCKECEWLTVEKNEYGELYETCGSKYEGMKPLYNDRPPQSWCYVQEVR